MFYADAMGFLAPQGQPPVADPNLKLDLVHMTAAPPFLKTTNEIFAKVCTFHNTITGQSQLEIIPGGEGWEDLIQGKTGVIMGLQGPPEDATLNGLLDLNNMCLIQIMALAYSGKNRYGSGFLDPYGPLTDDGKQLIKMIAEAGMILDLSHLGHQTAWDALEYIEILGLVGKLPVMASHGGCYGVEGCYNPRNLPDEVLKKISRMDGVVGIYTLTFGLHPDPDRGLAVFISCLRHAVNICGENHVMLGTDGVYQTQDIEEWKRHHQGMMNDVPNAEQMRARWPDNLLNSPERMADIEMLISGGFSRSEVEKIMGKNFLEFLRRSL